MIGRNHSNSSQASNSALSSLQWLTVVVLPIVAGWFSVSCSFLPRKPAIERGMEALVKAYSKTRLIEPRICGGFHAGKYVPDSAGAVIDRANLETAQDLILRDVGNRNDPPA